MCLTVEPSDCIRNRHAEVLKIATWVQEYFRTAVIYHSQLLHQEMQLESLLLKEKAQFYAVMLPDSLGQSSSQRVKKTVKMCAVHR